jgi:methyltransferase (TIGR00027 family)
VWRRSWRAAASNVASYRVIERAVVSHTSDALCVLRASAEAARFGVHDPYAAWFITDAGRRVFELARAVDSTFAAYNRARYVETTRALVAAAASGRQIVVLGAGSDCRALALPELASVPVFLVDQPAMDAFRKQVLAQHGQAQPAHVKSVPFDLARGGLRPALEEAGWRPGRPSFLLAEGVLMYLPSPSVLRILDPTWLPPDSAVWCDLWTAPRVARLNAAVLPRLSAALFQAFDLTDLPGLGYRRLTLTPLEQICAALGHHVPDLEPESWLSLSART